MHLQEVVNALGQPIDGKGPITTDTFRRGREGCTVLSKKIRRYTASNALGIKAIDAMIPRKRTKRAYNR